MSWSDDGCRQGSINPSYVWYLPRPCQFLHAFWPQMAAPGSWCLYGKKNLRANVSNRVWGRWLTLFTTICLLVPWKFEAGTPNIIGAIGLGAAIDYPRKELGMDQVEAHEQKLIAYVFPKSTGCEGAWPSMVPRLSPRSGTSFRFNHRRSPSAWLRNSTRLWRIAVRAGHHCAQPLLQYLQVPATTSKFFATKTDCVKWWALIKAREFSMALSSDSLYMAVMWSKTPHHKDKLKMLIRSTQQSNLWRCQSVKCKFDEEWQGGRYCPLMNSGWPISNRFS